MATCKITFRKHDCQHTRDKSQLYSKITQMDGDKQEEEILKFVKL